MSSLNLYPPARHPYVFYDCCLGNDYIENNRKVQEGVDLIKVGKIKYYKKERMKDLKKLLSETSIQTLWIKNVGESFKIFRLVNSFSFKIAFKTVILSHKYYSSIKKRILKSSCVELSFDTWFDEVERKNYIKRIKNFQKYLKNLKDKLINISTTILSDAMSDYQEMLSVLKRLSINKLFLESFAKSKLLRVKFAKFASPPILLTLKTLTIGLEDNFSSYKTWSVLLGNWYKSGIEILTTDYKFIFKMFKYLILFSMLNKEVKVRAQTCNFHDYNLIKKVQVKYVLCNDRISGKLERKFLQKLIVWVNIKETFLKKTGALK